MTDNILSKVKWESLLDSAVSEIEYSIKTKRTKSEEEREHYLRNAVRFIEEAKEIYYDEKTKEEPKW